MNTLTDEIDINCYDFNKYSNGRELSVKEKQAVSLILSSYNKFANGAFLRFNGDTDAIILQRSIETQEKLQQQYSKNRKRGERKLEKLHKINPAKYPLRARDFKQK